ncbi:MAG: hypothetical protein HZA46_00600 [Planctomycetales bacterium]|nr:hypothetical protein [Planctomycetales bacterium]
MALVIRQSWWHSLAAVTLVSVFGSVELSAQAAESPESPVVKVVAQKEKPGKEARIEKETREGGKRGVGQAEAKERLVNLEREIDELRAAGKLDQAEKLTREFKELQGHLEGRREIKGEKPAEASDELRGRLKDLEAENARLRELVGGKEKGKGGEGKELPLKKTPEKSDGGKKGAEGAAEVQNKLKAIENQIAELRKAGRKEEAEKLTGVAKELAQHLAKAPPATKGGVSPEEKEKLQLAHKELAKLRAEGRHEDANRLEQQIKDAGNVELRKKLTEKGFEKPGATSHELGPVLKELREEINRLRDEVAELRRAVKGSEDKPAPRK